MSNKTLCSAFWNHTNIRGGDRIFPCCRFKRSIAQFDGNLAAVLDIPEYQDLRAKSLAGEHIPECEKCYMEERLGKQSLRQEFNSAYTTDTVELKFLEIGFDNICNLTCDGCWGEFSSAWADRENPDRQKKLNVIQIRELTNVPNTITKIIFLGGEPLMTNRHTRFLKSLDDLSDIEIIYYTNGMFLLNAESIELLKTARAVNFILSIDGVGQLNEKVRSGSVWAEILQFIDQINSLGFKLSIHSVLHVNNWQGFEDLSKFVLGLDVDWTLGVLTYPAQLSAVNLSTEDKEKFIQSLNDFYIPNKDYVIGFLKNETDNTNRKIFKLEPI